MIRKKSGLLIEASEFKNEKNQNVINSEFKKYNSCRVTTVRIENDEQAKRILRERGTYITIEFKKTCGISDEDFENVVDVISLNIKKFTDEYKGQRIIVVGIGNRNITADSIGPKTIDRIIVTRALECTEFIGESLFGNVCAISADVFGVTGIESAELIEGLANILKPKLIVVVDSLATTSVSRLCKSVQISNTSLIPGGGIKNDREIISPQKINVPIVSIGIPTVINVMSLIDKKEETNDFDDLIAIPPRIDDMTDSGAKLISFALNKALHSDLETEDILKFLY